MADMKPKNYCGLIVNELMDMNDFKEHLSRVVPIILKARMKNGFATSHYWQIKHASKSQPNFFWRSLAHRFPLLGLKLFKNTGMMYRFIFTGACGALRDFSPPIGQSLADDTQ